MTYSITQTKSISVSGFNNIKSSWGREYLCKILHRKDLNEPHMRLKYSPGKISYLDITIISVNQWGIVRARTFWDLRSGGTSFGRSSSSSHKRFCWIKTALDFPVCFNRALFCYIQCYPAHTIFIYQPGSDHNNLRSLIKPGTWRWRSLSLCHGACTWL